MDGARRPSLARAGVRLVALTLLISCLFNVAISPSSTVLAAACAGDEQILLAPSTPRVGDTLMVAAMSGASHEDVLLLGPNGPIPVTRVAIGERFVWQEIVVVNRPGAHLFVFGVAGGPAPVTACADASVHVAEPDCSPLVASLNPYGEAGCSPTGPGQPAGDPDEASADDGAPDLEGEGLEPSGRAASTGAPRSTSTRRPTRTPTPTPDNGNENDNVTASAAARAPTKTPTSTRVPTSTPAPTSTRTPREPTATHTPRPTATDTPEATPTLEPPSLGSLSPSRPVCGQALTINGERFGSSRSAVDGKVRIDGRDASIDSWNMTRIQVSVPISVRAGNDRELEVVVAGNRVARSIPISC